LDLHLVQCLWSCFSYDFFPHGRLELEHFDHSWLLSSQHFYDLSSLFMAWKVRNHVKSCKSPVYSIAFALLDWLES
jgi:hypothetical protein